MKPITKTRLILAGLVTVHVMLDIGLGIMGPPPPLAFFEQVVVIPTQGVLLGFWIAMGRRWAIPWRACLGIAIVAAAAFVQNRLATDCDRTAFVLLIWEMWLASLTLLALRIMGLEMLYAGVPATTPGPFQFSLLELFSWTTATAVFFASLKYFGFYHHSIGPFGPFAIGELAVSVVCFVVLALTAMWLVFGRQWSVERCFGCSMVVVVAAVAFSVTVGAPANPNLIIELLVALTFSVYTAWLIASLSVIRWAGYRLEWQWRFRRRQSEAPTG